MVIRINKEAVATRKSIRQARTIKCDGYMVSLETKGTVRHETVRKGLVSL